MRALDRKLLRDLYRLRWQALSIAALVACGVMAELMMKSAFDSIEAARASFYDRSHFADLFAPVRRAPQPLATRIARIPGVAVAETRVVLDVTLDVPGLVESAVGHVVSLPPAGGLNLLHLRAGRLPGPRRADEVVVSERFAETDHLAPGDSIAAVMNGRWQRLRIVGVGVSPEFVIEVQPGAFTTDSRRYGILWMDRDALAAAYGMEGAFNDVVVALAPGAREADVVAALDALLAPYGGFGAYGRADQISSRILDDEFRQNRIFGTILPAIFLGIAAFLLNVVLGRLIGIERDQIGILKAFGYTDRAVAVHYLRFALTVVLAGAALGIPCGMLLGRRWTALYAAYFRFPVLDYRVSWTLVLGAMAVSAAAATAGALAAVRRAARLPPAEAMRPEAPQRYRVGRIERLLPRLAPDLRMILRGLTRRPVRTLLAVSGIAMSAGVLIFGYFWFGAIGHAADLQFYDAQRGDVTVTFREPRALAVRHDLAHLPGVSEVELFRVVPIRIAVGNRSRRVALNGLEPGARLRRVVDRHGVAHAPPGDGLLLTAELARVLGVAPGDTVQVEVLEGERPVLRLPVRATADELVGTAAYVELGTLGRRLRDGGVATGADLAVAAGSAARVHRLLKATPLVAGVSTPAGAREAFRTQLAESLSITATIIAMLASVISVAVIYNDARISLSERARELASLRVLGFTVHEVATILLGEQAVVTLLGIPLGFLVGPALALLVIHLLNSEVFRTPFVVVPSIFVYAAGVVIAAGTLAAIAVRRRLGRLDLVAVLKTRE